MKKLVNENMDEFLSERFVEDEQIDGRLEPEEFEEDEEVEEEPEEEEIEEPQPEKTSNEKAGFFANIEEETLENENFRKVLYTGENTQLVLMTLQPEEELGEETHENDQFFRFEAGEGLCIINGNEYEVSDGDSVIIPAGAEHNIINIGEESLKMYTLYSPPHHKDGIILKTKEEAEESTEEFDGKTTE